MAGQRAAAMVQARSASGNMDGEAYCLELDIAAPGPNEWRNAEDRYAKLRSANARQRLPAPG
jgi:hypothetical protein